MAQQLIPPEALANIPKKFNIVEQYIAGTSGGRNPTKGKTVRVPDVEGLTPVKDRNARQGRQFGTAVTGYQKEITWEGMPTVDPKNQPMPRYFANYDAEGNFLNIKPERPYQINDEIIIQPEINAQGELVNANPSSARQNEGGFGSFLGDFAKDFGPMILAGLGANYAAGNLGSLFSPSVSLAGSAGAAAGGATAADIAASNALAAANTAGYAGTSLASTAAGAGLLSSAAGAGANFMSPQVISTAGGAGAASTGATIASQIAAQGATPSLLQQAASFLNIKPETLASFAPSVIQGLLSAGGSYLTSEQGKEAAKTQADAQIQAAKIAADAARFRPVGVTTRFGSSNFTTDAAGNVTGAGYTPSAEITGYQDRLRTLAGQGMTDIEGARAAYQPLTGAAQSLFSLGQGYLAKTPEQAAQDYISKQQALLTPSRENQLAELRNRQFQTGRGGAATAQGGSLMNTNPEMAAYYNSLAQQDLVLAANADQEARNRITYGAGLFDTGANLQGRFYTGQTGAYAPFATAMDTSATLERLAERPLTLGTEIGARTTAGTAAGGRFLSEGITGAAQTMAPANAYSGTGNLLAGAANSPNVTGLLNNAFGVTPTQPTITQQQLIDILLGNKKSAFAA